MLDHDPQVIAIQASAFDVPDKAVRLEAPQLELGIGAGTQPLDTLPLFGGAK